MRRVSSPSSASGSESRSRTDRASSRERSCESATSAGSTSSTSRPRSQRSSSLSPTRARRSSEALPSPARSRPTPSARTCEQAPGPRPGGDRRCGHPLPAGALRRRRRLGLGSRGAGLGMRVIAYDPFVPPDRFRELGVERLETLDEVYAAADFLTLHLPLTADTQDTIGRAALAKMRDGVHIVNAARGELVDEDALLEA